MYSEVKTIPKITHVYSTNLSTAELHHHTHCGSPAFIEWYTISYHSYWPTLSSMSKTPESISFGRGHYSSRKGNTICQVEARDHNHYWITCWVDNMGVKFTIQVDQCLVIDSNPLDVLSQFDQVGSLIWLWWGHLSKLVCWSWRMQYWWLGREMRGRGECREGLSGTSSEGWRIWNIKIDWAASSLIASSFTLLMILQTFLEQIILIQHLTHMTHTALRQYPTPHWVKSLIKWSFHLYPIFPLWVTMLHFITHFSFWIIIWSIIWDGTFWNISLTHWWAIAYRSQKCYLVIHDSLPYIKRLSVTSHNTHVTLLTNLS